MAVQLLLVYWSEHKQITAAYFIILEYHSALQPGLISAEIPSCSNHYSEFLAVIAVLKFWEKRAARDKLCKFLRFTITNFQDSRWAYCFFFVSKSVKFHQWNYSYYCVLQFQFDYDRDEKNQSTSKRINNCWLYVVPQVHIFPLYTLTRYQTSVAVTSQPGPQS